VSNLIIVTPPTSEPVDVTTAKNFLRVTTDQDDDLIGILITAAREVVETFTGLSVATKTYRQQLDSFPFFTDTALSQAAWNPSYNSLPRYSTAMWNYSQMIKLYAPPLLGVLSIKYVDPNNVIQTIDPANYIVDSANRPARIFPGPGYGYWPACQYVPNAVAIDFVAGFDTPPSSDVTVPRALMLAILMLTAGFYENREAQAFGSFNELPFHIQSLLYAHRVMDVAPTRG